MGAAQGPTSEQENPANADHSNRLAAGQGKLQEVDLGPAAAARTEQAWRRLGSGAPEEDPTTKKKQERYGYQWRKPKRRNSEAERREQMVEAVLREAKRASQCQSHPPVTH